MYKRPFTKYMKFDKEMAQCSAYYIVAVRIWKRQKVSQRGTYSEVQN